MIEINQPNITNENQQQALLQMRSYLYQLSGQLNWAFSTLETGASTGSDIAIVGADGAIKESTDEVRSPSEVFNDLKGLIIKSADIVNAYYDTIKARLDGQYVAESDFGTFQENLTSTITATAEGVVQQFGYESRLDALDAAAAGFDVYRNKTEGFIRQGFIDYDEHGVPIIGVAIGQNLKSTTVMVDGQTVEQFDSAQSCAFYTSEKVSFRIGGNEVAYISNRKLYIKDAEVTGSLTVGGWLMSHGSAGLTLRYIGG